MCVESTQEVRRNIVIKSMQRVFEEVGIISDVKEHHSFIPSTLGAALPWSQDDLWTCLGNLGNQIPWQ